MRGGEGGEEEGEGEREEKREKDGQWKWLGEDVQHLDKEREG